jgi:4-hydroxy-3-polyprenylbenzoate decarboxylase
VKGTGRAAQPRRGGTTEVERLNVQTDSDRNPTPPPRRLVVGVTGASGAWYAHKLIDCLCRAEVEVHLVLSPPGKRLFRDELDIDRFDDVHLLGRREPKLVRYSFRDIGARIASGSFATEGMVICPCSSHTLAATAAGLGDNLLTRAAAVVLKEARRLIVVPREMPMSRMDLLNCLRLQEAGAIICPAAPGFYLRPQCVEDLVDFVVAKVLDLLHVPHSLENHWDPEAEPKPAPLLHAKLSNAEPPTADHAPPPPPASGSAAPDPTDQRGESGGAEQS